ncbi:threonine aldolase family protein [Deinococcus marmoris]|uniref:Low-specificity L-threonine aldolase n=1 Tax=Deinococcus marmoris TaxID=249408 RepID=A0A1U7NR07_9DEIO|nr:threonine aldolase family protein [Deinococcus marmoris]OLV15347.1 Low-specificity L-threonine aldolase [Deinococcus marmoris]
MSAASPDLIDLYSDTQTRPTPGMRAAMAQAVVGDEQSGDDPTTLELCGRVAGLLGMEAGVFLPSGTMCNLIGILTHTRPGDELICDHQSHIYGTEAAGAAAIAGVSIRAIISPHGIFGVQQVEEAVRPVSRTAPRSRLLSAEQTTNFSGGAVWPLAELQAVRDVAQQHGLKCHLDGARLLNASAASGVSPADYAAGWDSAWIDLSKGLGCPVGAVLCGSAAFVEDAWQWKYRLGGAMRQSGVLAAAGVYALDHHLEGLRADHENAQAIWGVLSGCELFQFDPPQPASNILRFTFDPSTIGAEAFAAGCLTQGVRVRSIGGNFIRVTTHLDVSASETESAAQTMLSVALALAEGV